MLTFTEPGAVDRAKEHAEFDLELGRPATSAPKQRVLLELPTKLCGDLKVARGVCRAARSLSDRAKIYAGWVVVIAFIPSRMVQGIEQIDTELQIRALREIKSGSLGNFEILRSS
jgi:hypothetical protein